MRETESNASFRSMKAQYIFFFACNCLSIKYLRINMVSTVLWSDLKPNCATELISVAFVHFFKRLFKILVNNFAKSLLKLFLDSYLYRQNFIFYVKEQSGPLPIALGTIRYLKFY